jgi:N-acetylglucosaminyldiphosphoundecaprenol N-acetyl-beta-D-mannosaminyltransferase
VAEAIRTGGHQIFAGHNLHSVYLYHRDAEMRRLYAQAGNVFVDGMPLVWWGRAVGLPLAREHRNTPLDWLPEVLTTAAREGWRVFYLGSTPEVAERGAAELRRRWPSLKLETHQGYFDMTLGSAESEAVVARIREYRPHLLCLGMGMPRQEQWAARFASRTDANCTLCVGALMELLAGELPVPPRWIGRAGLEWLFRLVTKPGRVSRRYLFEPWFLLPLALRDLASRRSRVLPELPPPPHP